MLAVMGKCCFIRPLATEEKCKKLFEEGGEGHPLQTTLARRVYENITGAWGALWGLCSSLRPAALPLMTYPDMARVEKISEVLEILIYCF